MITDIYTIEGPGDAIIAVDGLVKAGRFSGMTDSILPRLQKLSSALLAVGQSLEKVENIQLWMETKQGEAVVHMKADSVVDLTEEDHLKALSTSGKNTQRKGLFEKIKGAFEELAISDNEELNTYGYIPAIEYGTDVYPVTWNFTPDSFGGDRAEWNARAADDLEYLADSVDVGFSSEQVELAARMRYH